MPEGLPQQQVKADKVGSIIGWFTHQSNHPVPEVAVSSSGQPHQSVTAKGLTPVPVSAEWFLNRVTEMWYYKTHSD